MVTNLTGIEYQMRAIVSRLGSAEATPEAVGKEFGRFASSGGGVSGAGSVIVFARSSGKGGGGGSSTGNYGNHGNRSSRSPLGFVAEVDRYTVHMRTPAPDEVKVAQTNHFVEYGVGPDDPAGDPLSPWLNFGKPVARPGVSSHWRLQTLKSGLDSRHRLAVATGGGMGTLALGDVGGLLAQAGHGSTEHSVSWAPDALRFGLAVAAPESTGGAWDAPYQPFVEYGFEEVFAGWPLPASH